MGTDHNLADAEGFTLIELLVVVIIIGILAAIGVPSLLQNRDAAEQAAARSDARNAATEVETYFTANLSYPPDQAAFDGLGIERSSVFVTLTYVLGTDAGGTTGFCVTAEHSRTTPSPDAIYDSLQGGVQSGSPACSVS